ncbi:MAG: hypothetical protein AAGJ52_06520 [Pseudomonadota bacterium]
MSAPVQAQVGTELDTVSTNYGRYVSMILSPSAARGATGIEEAPLVAYENRSIGRQGLAVSRCFDPLCRSVDSATLDDRGSSNGAGIDSRILRGADGHAIIIHRRIGVGSALRVVRCGVANCLGSLGAADTINTITPDQGVAVSMDAAIGSDGFPVIAALLQSGGTDLGLWVIKCSDSVCSLPTTQTQIDPSRPLSGRVIDMVIGASGFPQIAFQDRENSGSNGQMAVLTCNDHACAGQDEALSSLDDLGGGTGRIIDMKLNSSGHPVLAYTGLNSTLRVIRCDDPDCAGGNDLPNIVPTLGSITQAIAMDLDSQDRPAMAAQNTGLTPDGLEIIFCNDPSCSGGDERRVDVFQSDQQDIALGAWVDAVFDPNDRLQIVYQTVERANSTVFLGSLYQIRCEFDGCGLIFADRFEAP